jgi:hypothetical protein
MTSLARTSVSALPRGHEFARVEFTVSADSVRAYLEAVGDAGAYEQCVPPLAVLAHALTALQTRISLPDGALHTGQEIEHASEVRAGDQLWMTGRIAQRSERQGAVISVIELEIGTNDAVAMRGRTTILAPAGAS